ncbi:hypothetical protein DTO166G4_8847 [Paecilomyces variotii]|uniref:Uncharacterized protein n=1 Tax=Byssochlamys spectabilis TaxID=264951 RepID=A0A443HU99_BYSSP|nr:hypothetical protein C8Q69DRAFT_251218 [Paecilomyces variotii]KAJ9209563.1 hypothetical protein DTO166G4_8847 [Paecilomyces variotii]KAJ9364856.1 hypothetical protein DTO280E4_1151 [Paecilomyces variotii]KAJ9369579.1 hypothetical protein DTO282E5_5708 [Paecilomyces variotii]RWQ95387.1 hypothetical protein C8Q69DRAFT_251218 [Paecilomyces variotii]
MHLATLVCFCISAASAVKHYGLTPTEDVKNMVEYHARALSGNDMNMNLTSLFTTDSQNFHDGADFLAAELGIFNKTIADVFPPHSFKIGNSSLQARSAINGECQGHGNIEDNLSSNQITAVCAAMTSAAVGGVTGLIGVVDSKVCVEAGTGHPLPSCKSIFAIINTSGVTFTSITVNTYCPQFLSFFVACHGADAEATASSDSALELTGFNSQKNYNCQGPHPNEKCIETSA